MLRRSAQCTPGDSGAGALPINPEAMSHTMQRLFYSTGQVARQLGTTPAAIRLLCENRLIAAETSPGGQWRVPASEVERLKRDGLPAIPRPLPNPSAPARNGTSNRHS